MIASGRPPARRNSAKSASETGKRQNSEHHSESREEKSNGSAIVDTIVAAIVAAAPPVLVFYAGWMFLHAYLRPFGIQINELGLSAWQIGAMSLSGLTVGDATPTSTLNLTWLAPLAGSLALWLTALHIGTGRRRNLAVLGAFILAITGFAAFACSVDQLSKAGSALSRQLIDGKGVLYVPNVAFDDGSSSVSSAIRSCIVGERLVPIFLASGTVWSFCRTQRATQKGLVFVTNDVGKVVSLRRFDIQEGGRQ